MKILETFAKEFNNINNKKIEPGSTLNQNIEFLKNELLQEEFNPSITLKSVLNKLSIRAKEPMKVAIVGQFSSGKSTFLNAIISKEILPTGITPVTSKVNFIKYGEKQKLEITYNDGLTEFHSIDSLKSFTDQREGINDIKYITLYMPLDILKEITFVDTPGLNSQSADDTKTTLNVLKDVDGIIWVALIDSAGKFSEEKVLKEFLKFSNIKSLCVLNQKDKLSENEIKKAVLYIKEQFGTFFDEVVPISAKQALLARKNSKKEMTEDKIEKIAKLFKESLKNNIPDSISFFRNEYNNFKNSISELFSSDRTKQIRMLEQSNINTVIDFIEEQIRPNADRAKELSIKNDMKNICDILIEQYKIIIKINIKLFEILKNYESKLDKYLKMIKEKYRDILELNYTEIENIISLISDEIYNNLKYVERYRYIRKKSVLGLSKNMEKVPYKIPWFDSEIIYKNLFYDDDKIDKMLKRVLRELNEVEKSAVRDIFDLYKNLEFKVKSWQNLYEFTSKNREIASDKEFADLRKFVSRVFENILQEFLETDLKIVAKIEHEFGYIKGALEFNYQNATKTTVAFFKRKIFESITFYEEDPQNYAIYKPTKNDIDNQIKIHFSFNKLDTLIKSKRNFLYKNCEFLQEEFKTIANKKEEFILKKEKIQKEKISKIERIKASF